MAGFGPIQSPNPNVLFNPLAVDQAVAGMQRNRLMMEHAQEDRAMARVDREREEIGRVSASLLALPAAARPQAYSAAVADLQRSGLAGRAPAEYPGDAQIEMLARAAMPAAAQFQLAEKQRASQALMGMLGGIMGGGDMGGGGTPPIAPPDVVADTTIAAPRRDYASAEAARATMLDAPPDVLAQASAARTTVPQAPGGYRANPGVAGQYAGLPPPTGTINPGVGGGAERAAIAAAAMTNPSAVPGLLMQMQAQRAMQAERATDNQRADAQFRLQEQRAAMTAEQQARQAQAQEQAMRLQAGAAERQAEAARRQAETAGVPSGYRRTAEGGLEPVPGGPADPAAQRGKPESATEGERKAAGYLGRMQGAERLLEDMVRDGYDPGNVRDRIAGLTPGVGNFLSTEKGQQYMNAAAEWARAKLRLESGAVIGEEEAKAEARTYFPMPGDSPATVAQKARLRATAVDGVKAQAGRAVPAAAGPAGADGGTPLVVPPAPGGSPQRLRFNPATGRIE